MAGERRVQVGVRTDKPWHNPLPTDFIDCLRIVWSEIRTHLRDPAIVDANICGLYPWRIEMEERATSQQPTAHLSHPRLPTDR